MRSCRRRIPGAHSRAKMAETCAHCHADRALIEKTEDPEFPRPPALPKSVHGLAWRPEAGGDVQQLPHSHQILRANDPTSTVYREEHPQDVRELSRPGGQDLPGSIHGTAMRQGFTRSPVCTDCTGSTPSPGSGPEFPGRVTQVTKTCASCHQALEITRKYGFRVTGWRRTRTVSTVSGGARREPTAANCSSWPRLSTTSGPPRIKSSISKNNLAAPAEVPIRATENFAKGAVPRAVTQKARRSSTMARLLLLLILGTIRRYGSHNGLDFLRSCGGIPPAGRRIRHHGDAYAAPVAERRGSTSDVGLRALAARSLTRASITLVYTALPEVPESWPFAGWRSWRKAPLRALIHRGAAVSHDRGLRSFICSICPRRRGAGSWSNLPRVSDIQEVTQNIGYLLGLRAARGFDPSATSRRPSTGVVGLGDHEATGLAPLVRNRYPSSSSPSGPRVATVIHLTTKPGWRPWHPVWHFTL